MFVEEERIDGMCHLHTEESILEEGVVAHFHPFGGSC